MIDSRDIKFLTLAGHIADVFSKDPSTKVGAVAVGQSNNQVAFGYNGFPPRVADSHDRLYDRVAKLALTIHAEENALINAPFAVETLYVTHHPCAQCALRIVASRTIRRVVFGQQPGFEARWTDSLAMARTLLEEAGVRVEAATL